jgi:hypothetical protein
VPTVGPLPDRDDPDDLRWGLLPFAFYRGIASLLLGHDPVAEGQRHNLAKESQESFRRLMPLEHEAYKKLRERRRAR